MAMSKKPDQKGPTLCPSICVIVEKIPHHRSKEQWLLGGQKWGGRHSFRAVTLHWSPAGGQISTPCHAKGNLVESIGLSVGCLSVQAKQFPSSAVHNVCREAVRGHIGSEEASHLFI